MMDDLPAEKRHMLKRILTTILLAATWLLPLTSSALVPSPCRDGMAGMVENWNDGVGKSSWNSIVPSVSYADSFYFCSPDSCRNNPMQGVDPYGLLTEEKTIEILKRLSPHIVKTSQEFNVPARYIAAVIYAEVRHNVGAIDQVQGSKGLKGIVMWKGGDSL